MQHMGVTEWRSRLGDLRQGTRIIVVMYRRKPAAILVPLPPALWEDALPFLTQLMKLRDQHLQPPASESVHTWVRGAYQPIRINVEEARRGSAKLFGQIMHNTPVVLTFYNYDNAVMVPLPPGLSQQELETIHQQIKTFVESSGIG